MQPEFSKVKSALVDLIGKVGSNRNLSEAQAAQVGAALTLAIAAVDLGYALTEGRAAYVDEKRLVLAEWINRVMWVKR
jgi:hypothetical protein